MNVPNAIIERRAERERWAERHRDAIENHQRSLAIVEAELDCICFAIAAIEDAAKAPNAEAVEGVGWVAATSFGYWCPRGRSVGESGNSLVNPQAPEAESAGRSGVACPHCGDVTEQSVLLSEFTCGKCDRVFDLGDARVFRVPLEPAKKPRAPKRDIRGMVLEYVENYTGGNLDQDQISRWLGVSMRAVASAIVYWQAKGRLTLDGGVVRLTEIDMGNPISPDPDPVELNDYGRPVNIPHDAPDEADGENTVRASSGNVFADLGLPDAGRRLLVAFLTHTPDSTMAEIREAGIEAADVYLAEKEGVVFAKAHGLYALVEPQQSEAAE